MPGTPSTQNINVLIADDEVNFATVLKDELTDAGLIVFTAFNGKDAVKMLENKEFDVCLLDITMPYLNGLQVLKQAAMKDIPTEFIMLTAHATINTAIESMRLGAYDYLTKPSNFEKIFFLIKKAYERRVMRQEKLILRRLKGSKGKFSTKNPLLLQIIKEAEKVAKTDATVLLLGESGSGKGLLSEHIHNHSARSAAPCINLNTATVQETLLESELFGHEKGAFTGAHASKTGLFEMADNGTIFLDEIGEIPPQTQVKLLRVIENGSFFKVGGTKEIHVNVRIIAATNQNLKIMVDQGTFRPDLYYRLSIITFTIPPLRERKEDITLLVEDFLSTLPVGYKKKISKKALQLLTDHDWPGNIRELHNVISRAAILCESDRIEPENLPEDDLKTRSNPSEVPVGAPAQASSPASATVAHAGSHQPTTLKDMEKEHIKNTLEQTGGHRKNTAELLGIDAKTLWRKIKEYGLE